MLPSMLSLDPSPGGWREKMAITVSDLGNWLEGFWGTFGGLPLTSEGIVAVPLQLAGVLGRFPWWAGRGRLAGRMAPNWTAKWAGVAPMPISVGVSRRGLTTPVPSGVTSSFRPSGFEKISRVLSGWAGRLCARQSWRRRSSRGESRRHVVGHLGLERSKFWISHLAATLNAVVSLM